MITKNEKIKIKKAKTKKKNKERWESFFKKSKGKLNNLNNSLLSNKTFFCIDTEEHEFSGKLLEIGITTYIKGELRTSHFIIEEHYNIRNKKYVPDNKDNFNFGKSKKLPLNDIKNIIRSISNDSHYLVGHAVHNDIYFLESINSMSFMNTFDTQIYQKHKFETREEISLINLCKKFEIETENLHNAGNDAHYTMRCLIELGKK